jgi:predicted RNA-binding Zn-ribbon protein involved in translation (DUF1610 family)
VFDVRPGRYREIRHIAVLVPPDASSEAAGNPREESVMTELGRPFDPADPDGDRSSIVMMKTSDLLPLVDTSGGVQLADREGVFAHSFKCRNCTLHFVLFSWSMSRHTPQTIRCPECGNSGEFMQRITVLSESRRFSFASDRQPEIYDVWPFHSR